MIEKESDLHLYLAAMDASINGIVITDHREPDEPIIYCNKAFEKMTGYGRNEIIGHNCRFLQGDDRGQEAREAIRQAIKQGEAVEVELRNYHKCGRPFWNELALSPLKDHQGKVIHYVGVQQDITRRKTAEEELIRLKQELEQKVQAQTAGLRESEQYLAGIVETIRESLLVLDPQLTVLSANEHFLKFFRMKEEEVVGCELKNLKQGAWNIKSLLNLLHHILPDNNPFEGFELEAEFPEIGRKLLRLNARQITVEGQYQNRILLAMEDATERHQAEQRKEQFISVASHEMKTPLTSIKGHLQILQKKAAQLETQEFDRPLQTANKAADRLGGLIDDLLEVARLQSGKLQFNYTHFDVDELIAETVEIVQATTVTHQIKQTGKATVQLYADRDRISQVIVNLLNNAIKYSPRAQTIELYVSVLAGFVKVAVTDYGMGIPQLEQKKIFEQFYRSSTVLTGFQGVGIGLYVCSQIVQAHKGTLWVDSEEGKGAVFSFTVPL